jgi:excisionase family DNA binding protein
MSDLTNYQTLPNRLFTYSETAEILNLSPGTLRIWVSAKRVPCVKMGKAVRFTREQIKQMMQGVQ